MRPLTVSVFLGPGNKSVALVAWPDVWKASPNDSEWICKGRVLRQCKNRQLTTTFEKLWFPILIQFNGIERHD